MRKLFAAGAVSFSLLAVGCESTEGDRLMRMNTQPKYKYYQQSEFWADGQAMRIPPRGTISREQKAELPLLDWKEDDVTFKDAFPPALKVNAELIRRGQSRYEIVCATCHGHTGDGKAIPGENMQLHPAPSLVALKDKPVGYFFEVATNGFGYMPSFAGELSAYDRWAIAGYIKTLGASRGVPLSELPQDVQQKLLAQPEGAAPGPKQHQKETL